MAGYRLLVISESRVEKSAFCHRFGNPKPRGAAFHIASGKQLVGTLGGFYFGFRGAALFNK